VNPRSPKDVPPPSPDEGSESADTLLTSEELFGDLIDAPIEAKAEPARAASTPIRVQVNEEGQAGPPKPKPPELGPEDVGALLGAFGDGQSRSEPTPARAAESPKPASEAPKPGSPRSASPLASADTRELNGLLDVLGAGSEPKPPEDPEEAARTLVPGRVVSPFAGSPAARRAEPPPAPKPKDAQPATDLDRVLESMLSPGAFLDSETRARTDAKPAEDAERRTGAKFAALEPSIAASETSRMMIDLGALAEDALTSSSPSSPREPRGARSGVGHVYGPYTLLERVAAGGMAEVFKAKRSGVEGFEKVVAVKRILPHLSDNKEFVDMFIDEAKVVAGLTHPNIVQIFDLGRLDEAYFIAMEFVHGKDLRSIQRRSRDKGLRLPLDLSAYVVSRVCSALEHAHTRRDEQGLPMGLVHRDVSPQNILISFEGDVKLTDFGIAKATSKAASSESGSLRGKLLYMSPEQASGRPVDRRSDIFSLGVVLYELLTDRKPFMATSETAILEMVRACRVDPPSHWNAEVPEDLERIAMRALARIPEERYQDAADMHRDLERALMNLTPPSSQDLARLMELLFERDERGVREPPPERAGKAHGADPGAGPADDVSRLLRKHGIGS
jgi:serine/threonine protein kinase